MQGFESVRMEVERGRARVILDAPEGNRISERLLKDLHDALWEADDLKEVHAIVLKGAGADFSRGADAPPAEARADRRGNGWLDDQTWKLERLQRLQMTIFDMHKPVIAQVHGHCLGAGADLALLCDIVVCADDARIGAAESGSAKLSPNHMWIYHAGPQWAKHLLLTGRPVSGAQAATIGLALSAVPAAQLEGEVESLLDRLALVDAELLSANKRIVNLALELMGARSLQRLAAELDARMGFRPPAELTRGGGY